MREKSAKDERGWRKPLVTPLCEIESEHQLGLDAQNDKFVDGSREL